MGKMLGVLRDVLETIEVKFVDRDTFDGGLSMNNHEVVASGWVGKMLGVLRDVHSFRYVGPTNYLPLL